VALVVAAVAVVAAWVMGAAARIRAASKGVNDRFMLNLLFMISK
jgi:hypothetical protein